MKTYKFRNKVHSTIRDIKYKVYELQEENRKLKDFYKNNKIFVNKYDAIKLYHIIKEIDDKLEYIYDMSYKISDLCLEQYIESKHW